MKNKCIVSPLAFRMTKPPWSFGHGVLATSAKGLTFALRMTKPPWSFGHGVLATLECKRVNRPFSQLESIRFVCRYLVCLVFSQLKQLMN